MRTSLFSVGVLAMTAGAASAGILPPGAYRLHNHPDGSVTPPPYGARFDELADATPGHDVFTLNFDAPGSNAFMVLTATTITITGTAFGGRDIGGTYAADAFQGFYNFHVVYNLGVGDVPGDDDTWVNTANHSNFGTITGPGGISRNLVDERGSFPYSFRLGNEDNDLGHRGFPGISGWGWMSYINGAGGISHVEATDWLFTVEVPAPGAAALLGLGALVGLRRRR